MKRLKKAAKKLLRYVVDTAMGNGLMQEENTAQGQRRVMPGMPELLRKSGAEGIVLLKNEGVLPLKDKKVAVFGRCQRDWFYATVLPLMRQNLQRVKEDIDWFVAKYDYRNAGAPWKNSRDAVSRTMQKLQGIYPADPPYKSEPR